MIKVVIIEDELNAGEALKKLIPLIHDNIHIIGLTGYVEEAIKMIDSEKPDIVFLDIELENGTGFDVLKDVKNTSFQLIFTTAYNQYAIKAFKFSALDYLLKPIDPQELQSAITQAISKIETAQEHKNLLEVLKENLENKNKKIVLKTNENRFIISVDDIYRLEADGAYTTFITKSKKITVSKNIKTYDEMLGADFVRCHQSHLVNINYLLSMNKNDFLELTNGDLVPVSTRKKSNIMSFLK